MRRPWRIEGWDQTIFEYTFRAEIDDNVLLAEYTTPKQVVILICEWLSGTTGFDGVAVHISPKEIQLGSSPVLREVKLRLLWMANTKRGLVGKMYAEYIN